MIVRAITNKREAEFKARQRDLAFLAAEIANAPHFRPRNKKPRKAEDYLPKPRQSSFVAKVQAMRQWAARLNKTHEA